jgi:hypothetical protein
MKKAAERRRIFAAVSVSTRKKGVARVTDIVVDDVPLVDNTEDVTVYANHLFGSSFDQYIIFFIQHLFQWLSGLS